MRDRTAKRGIELQDWLKIKNYLIHWNRSIHFHINSASIIGPVKHGVLYLPLTLPVIFDFCAENSRLKVKKHSNGLKTAKWVDKETALNNDQ